MPRVFITGSTDGLGFLAAELLVARGHQVILHARNSARAADAMRRLPSAGAVGDLASIAQTRSIAEQANRFGRFDAVIQNAGADFRKDSSPALWRPSFSSPNTCTHGDSWPEIVKTCFH